MAFQTWQVGGPRCHIGCAAEGLLMAQGSLSSSGWERQQRDGYDHFAEPSPKGRFLRTTAIDTRHTAFPPSWPCGRSNRGWPLSRRGSSALTEAEKPEGFPPRRRGDARQNLKPSCSKPLGTNRFAPSEPRNKIVLTQTPGQTPSFQMAASIDEAIVARATHKRRG